MDTRNLCGLAGSLLLAPALLALACGRSPSGYHTGDGGQPDAATPDEIQHEPPTDGCVAEHLVAGGGRN